MTYASQSKELLIERSRPTQVRLTASFPTIADFHEQPDTKWNSRSFLLRRQIGTMTFENLGSHPYGLA
jgi:hypothetical protein